MLWVAPFANNISTDRQIDGKRTERERLWTRSKYLVKLN
jgi:hypothetical protein